MKIYFDIKKIFVNFAFEKATYGKNDFLLECS